MTKLGLGDSTRSEIEPGFWRRQFMPTGTSAQMFFDVLFGIVAPVLCFVFDPIVFKSEFDQGLFPQVQSFAYMVSAIEIATLSVWLICGRRLRPRTRLVGGILGAGAAFSGSIGVVILPFTLLGVLLFIGILGFIPFLTAFVYLRNAKRAFQLADDSASERLKILTTRPGASGVRSWIGSTILGCTLALGIPAGVNLIAASFVSASMKAVLHADAQLADIAVEEVRYLQFLAAPNLDEIVTAYAAETDPARKEELKRRYVKLTGNDIEERLRIMLD